MATSGIPNNKLINILLKNNFIEFTSLDFFIGYHILEIVSITCTLIDFLEKIFYNFRQECKGGPIYESPVNIRRI